MRPPGILRELVVAALLSAAGAAIFAVLSTLGLAQPLRASLLVVTSAYAFSLLLRSQRPTGRITAAAATLLLPVFVLAGQVTLPLAALLQISWIWLLRCVQFHRSLLAIGADLLLSLGALTAAAAAFVHTGSVFAGLWCLLLLQAFFVYIPKHWASQKPANRASFDAFDSAHQRAQTALRQLFNA